MITNFIRNRSQLKEIQAIVMLYIVVMKLTLVEHKVCRVYREYQIRDYLNGLNSNSPITHCLATNTIYNFRSNDNAYINENQNGEIKSAVNKQ